MMLSKCFNIRHQLIVDSVSNFRDRLVPLTILDLFFASDSTPFGFGHQCTCPGHLTTSILDTIL